jgi:hypothetical protein
MDHTPHDLLIEQAVDDAIEEGAFVPRWGWPKPRSYNGATGEERITGWQKVAVARNLGLIVKTAACEVCGRPAGSMRHGEIYARPLMARPICRSCHFKLHRRYGDPDGWEKFLSTMPAADWVRSLLTRELSRSEMLRIAEEPDVFAALRRLRE